MGRGGAAIKLPFREIRSRRIERLPVTAISLVLKSRVDNPPRRRKSELCSGTIRRCHEFRAHRIPDRLIQDRIDLGHGRGIDRPAERAGDWRQTRRGLRHPARLPLENRR